jgi:hypothetical protein
MPARPDSWSSEPRPEDGDVGAALREPPRRAGSPADGGVAVGSWQDIKSRFVDDPAGAIEAAEQLVRSALEQRVRALQDEAAAICARERDEDASSTETLRTRLIRYQQYCENLARSTAH